MTGRRARGHWFRELPSTWESAPLKWLSSIYAGGTPDRSNLDFWTDGTIPWLNSGSVNQQPVVEPSEFITQAGFDASSTRWVPKGALVMALAGQGKTKGMVSQLALTATVNQSMAAIIPERRVLARYLYWWLQSNYRNVRGMGGGELRDGLNLEMLGDIVCPLPPTQRQRDIATFLDRETAQIDAVIAKQEELIGLLGERRSAVIAHAVTKGLNPDAPTKDSGVEWLGEVPEHWVVDKLGRHTWIGNGSTPRRETAAFWAEGNIPWVNSGCTNSPTVTEASDFVTEVAVQQCHLPLVPAGSLLVALTGQGKTRGAAALLHIETTINQHLAYVTPTDARWEPKYLVQLLWAAYPHLRAVSEENGSTKGALTCGQLSRFKVPCPPRSEQSEIARWVSKQTEAMGHLVERAGVSIALMRERRAALISDAVTGRLDIESYGRGRPQEGVA